VERRAILVFLERGAVMYQARVTFEADGRVTEEMVDHVSWIRQEWHAGGQTLSRESRIVVRGRRVLMELLLPERGALARRFELPQTRAMLNALRKLGASGPRLELIGELEGGAGVDSCRARSSYVLFTHAYSESSPVRCGRCLSSVPLYRLPEDTHPERGRYWDALAWQQDYRRMDEMWFASGLGERYAHRQLFNPESELNRDGREVRDRLEEVLKKRVYYFQWRSKLDGGSLSESGKDEACPLCGRSWVLRGNRRGLEERFSRRCERCSLVSM
jgi:predicted  nucleic acid-binding Zn ribbon protein